MRTKRTMTLLIALGGTACGAGPAEIDPAVEQTAAPLLNAATVVRAVSPDDVYFIDGSQHLQHYQRINGKFERHEEDPSHTVQNFQVLDSAKSKLLVHRFEDDGLYLLEKLPLGPSAKLVDYNVKQFEGRDQNGTIIVYVLGFDGKLWREKGSWADRCQAEGSVEAFQLGNRNYTGGESVFVLGTDRNLWNSVYTPPSQCPSVFPGPLPRGPVDSNVKDFHVDTSNTDYGVCSYVYFSDETENNLHMFDCGRQTTKRDIAKNLKKFQPGSGDVFVLDTAGKLYSVFAKTTVDYNVEDFSFGGYQYPYRIMYVLSSIDRKLWKEYGSYNNPYKARQPVF